MTIVKSCEPRAIVIPKKSLPDMATSFIYINHGEEKVIVRRITERFYCPPCKIYLAHLIRFISCAKNQVLFLKIKAKLDIIRLFLLFLQSATSKRNKAVSPYSLLYRISYWKSPYLQSLLLKLSNFISLKSKLVHCHNIQNIISYKYKI